MCVPHHYLRNPHHHFLPVAGAANLHLLFQKNETKYTDLLESEEAERKADEARRLLDSQSSRQMNSSDEHDDEEEDGQEEDKEITHPLQ